MRSIETARGVLAIPGSEQELEAWDRAKCIAWIRQCDPNGATFIDDDPDDPPTDDELRFTIWSIVEDDL